MATSKKEPEHGLTPLKLSYLSHIAHLNICTSLQLAAFTGTSYKATRGHTLDLSRHGMADSSMIPVSTGTSPLIYRLSKKGARHLDVPLYPCPADLFMRHELEIRDVRVWLERIRRRYEHEALRLWKVDEAARIADVRPDAVFVYPLKGVKLTGLLEVDRGTESLKRWQAKFDMYATMMRRGDLKAAIGEDRGRVLVVTPDEKRRDAIVKVLSGMLTQAKIERDRFWVTKRSSLAKEDLTEAVWRVPEGGELRALVPDGVI